MLTIGIDLNGVGEAGLMGQFHTGHDSNTLAAIVRKMMAKYAMIGIMKVCDHLTGLRVGSVINDENTQIKGSRLGDHVGQNGMVIIGRDQRTDFHAIFSPSSFAPSSCGIRNFSVPELCRSS